MKRKIPLFFVIFSIFILISIHVYSGEYPTNKTIVLFGDSNTAGSNWSSNNYSQETKWSSILNNKLDNWNILNKGIEGNTTEHGRLRFNKDVQNNKPDVVTLMFGTNDSTIKNGKPKVSLSRFQENIEFYINQLKEHQSQIILMTAIPIIEGNGKDGYYFTRHKKEDYNINGPRDVLNKYNNALKSIAVKHKVPLIDINSVFIKQAGGPTDKHLINSGLLDSSGTHMTPKGAKLVAEEVLKKLGDK